MPIFIQIDSTAKVVITSFSGDISESDIRAAGEKIVSQPGFDPAFSHLIDFSEVRSARVSTTFVREFASRESIFNSTAKQVVVAPRDHLFGLARMVQIFRQIERPRMNVQVVRSKYEACNILGIKPDTIEHSEIAAR